MKEESQGSAYEAAFPRVGRDEMLKVWAGTTFDF